MDAFWVCENCGSAGINYNETRKCDICGELISPLSEFECVCSISEHIKDVAKSIEEYNNAINYFNEAINIFQSKLPDEVLSLYPKSRKSKAVDLFSKALADRDKCKQFVIIINKYDEGYSYFNSAKDLEDDMDLENAEKAYSKSSICFKETISYKDSKIILNKCQQSIKKIKTILLYTQACDLLEKAKTIDNYENIANIFSQILDYKDSNIKHQICVEHIKKIKEDELYADLFERFNVARNEQDLQSKEILLKRLLEEFVPEVSFERIKKLLFDVRNAYECVANENKYLKAKDNLTNSKTEKDFLEAKKLFLELHDYKDSKEMATYCDQKANEENYNRIYSEAMNTVKVTDEIKISDVLRMLLTGKKQWLY